MRLLHTIVYINATAGGGIMNTLKGNPYSPPTAEFSPPPEFSPSDKTPLTWKSRLVEVVVVLFILGVLAFILLPAVQVTRERVG